MPITATFVWDFTIQLQYQNYNNAIYIGPILSLGGGAYSLTLPPTHKHIQNPSKYDTERGFNF